MTTKVLSETSLAAEQMGEMSDAELFRRCQQYGEQARYWRQKFAGLLPEVNRRRLYECKGFSSIFEFAAKLAGLSREQVQRVLNLDQKFQAMPTLSTVLVNGEVSMHKLVRVASVATPENEKELAEKTKLLSKAALEVLVRDEKYARQISDNQNGLFTIESRGESVPGHRKVSGNSLDVKLMALILKLSEKVKEDLVAMDEKGLNVNDILLELLEKRKLELAQEKEELSREQEGNRRAAVLGKIETNRAMVTQDKIGNGQQQLTQKKPSRYIPAKIRHHLQQEYGTKCAKPACYKAAENIHHTARWSLSKNHDPRYLAPLCKEHHQIAHSIDGQYHAYRNLSQQEKRTMARRW